MPGLGLSSVAFTGALRRYPTYALLLKSYEGANTTTLWQDLSGHFIAGIPQYSTGFALTPNAQNGRAGYLATAASPADTHFILPALSTTVGDYTVTLALRVDEATNCYPMIAGDGPNTSSDYTYFGLNSSDNHCYYQRRVGAAIGPVVAVAAGQTAVVQYRLNSAGASVLVNGVVLASGLAWTPALWGVGTLGNQLLGQLLHGVLFGLAVSLGNDSDEQVAYTRAMFMAELGL